MAHKLIQPSQIDITVPEDLNDLSDVNTSGVSDGDVLTYDSGTSGWVAAEATGGGTASDFTDLGDVPASYSGQGEKFVAVKSDASGLEFVDAPSGGGGWDGTSLIIGDTPISRCFQEIATGTITESETGFSIRTDSSGTGKKAWLSSRLLASHATNGVLSLTGDFSLSAKVSLSATGGTCQSYFGSGRPWPNSNG